MKELINTARDYEVSLQLDYYSENSIRLSICYDRIFILAFDNKISYRANGKEFETVLNEESIDHINKQLASDLQDFGYFDKS